MKGAAGPVDDMLEIFVSGLEDDFEELLVAAGAANVFGRATPCAVQTDWGYEFGIGWADLFEQDLMVPIVAEIVEIGDGLAGFGEESGKLHIGFVNDFGIVERCGAPIQAVFLEFVEMTVGPTHNHLQRAVQAAELNGGRDYEATPDWRLYFIERHLQDVDGCLRFPGSHTVIVAK